MQLKNKVQFLHPKLTKQFLPLMLTFFLIPIYIFTFHLDEHSEELYSQRFLPSVRYAEISDSKLAEASGMVASRTNTGLFWIINDSGNDPKLYLINEKGATVHSYWIDGVINTDWEDLSIYQDKSSEKTQLFVGDIGDNLAVRECIKVLAFEEPTFKNSDDTIISTYNTYLFKYEDSARDAETLMVDPSTSKMYIISKREKNVVIYEAPTQLIDKDTMILSHKGNLPFHNITSGDISFDGSEILLKNYNAIFYWNKAEGETFVQAISKDHELLNYKPEPQGESICWGMEKDGFFTLSERSWASKQLIFFYKRNPQN